MKKLLKFMMVCLMVMGSCMSTVQAKSRYMYYGCTDSFTRPAVSWRGARITIAGRIIKSSRSNVYDERRYLGKRRTYRFYVNRATKYYEVGDINVKISTRSAKIDFKRIKGSQCSVNMQVKGNTVNKIYFISQGLSSKNRVKRRKFIVKTKS